MRYLFVCLFAGYVSGKICSFVLELLHRFVAPFAAKSINDLNFAADRSALHLLVLSMSAPIDFFFFFKFRCTEMTCVEILLICFCFLFLFNFLGEMPHVADVPATTMTEQAAGGFNIRTSMVLLSINF